jgi:hypothetical protein
MGPLRGVPRRRALHAALLRCNCHYVSNAPVSPGAVQGPYQARLQAFLDDARPTKSRFNFILNNRGLLPAISTDCGLVAGLAEMLHKNAEPAANEQKLGD